jgi:outer membrane lipoprotein SlyB
MSFVNRSLFVAATAALALGGCAYDPYQTSYPGPGTSYPPSYPTYPTPDVVRYGYVESIDTMTADRAPSGPGVGAIGGAIAGGVLGHQVGSGRGNTAAR